MLHVQIEKRYSLKRTIIVGSRLMRFICYKIISRTTQYFFSHLNVMPCILNDRSFEQNDTKTVQLETNFREVKKNTYIYIYIV